MTDTPTGTAEITPPPATTPNAEPATMTEYLVLVGDRDLWKQVAAVRARSATAAIRDHIALSGATEGTYVAVPARSWQPVTVKVETQTKLVLT